MTSARYPSTTGASIGFGSLTWPRRTVRPIASQPFELHRLAREVAERMGSRVELFEQIRCARERESLSIRALAERFGLHRRMRQAIHLGAAAA